MSGELFRAETGQGAFLNGTRLHVSAIPEIAGRWSPPASPTISVKRIAISPSTSGSSSGPRASAAAARRPSTSAMCGRPIRRLLGAQAQPWDSAAGAVMVREAGGRITDFLNCPVNIYHPEVCASNGLIHDELLGLLNQT